MRAGAARPGRARRRRPIRWVSAVAAVLDRQRVDTLDDHHRLLLGDGAGGHRVPDRLVVAVQGVREVQAAFGVAFGLPGGVGPVGCWCRRRRLGRRGRGGRRAGRGAELELGDLVPQRGQGGQVGVGLGGRQGPQPEVGDLAELVGDGGDRGRDRVLPGVVECRCHTGNSGIGHRQLRAGNRAFRAAVEKYFESFWSRRCGGFETALARLLHHRPAPPGSRPQPRAVPLPVAAPFNPTTTRSRETVSTPARWRSLLDHRESWRASSTTPGPPAIRPGRSAPVQVRAT